MKNTSVEALDSDDSKEEDEKEIEDLGEDLASDDWITWVDNQPKKNVNATNSRMDTSNI